ncbi:hypothetical protein OBBRIDRAFT_883167 [Obba rivulosa]|uniref:Uncharacterized protein n=1 Tax=Obba rivulosa TaxID=1052685 RepID=A0A8E2DUJ3_9APHY|nr:hypothetical protein OBBRIDRAFT_883167 [Obba rivulosa]
MARAKVRKPTNQQRALAAICRQGSGSFTKSTLWEQVQRDATEHDERLGPRAHLYIENVFAELKMDDHLINTDTGHLRVNPSVRPVYRRAQEFAEKFVSTEEKYRALCKKLAAEFQPDRKKTKAMLFQKVQDLMGELEVLKKQLAALPVIEADQDACPSNELPGDAEADYSMTVCDASVAESNPFASPARLPKSSFNPELAYLTPNSEARRPRPLPDLPEPECSPSPTPCPGLLLAEEDAAMDLGEGPSQYMDGSRASTPDARTCRAIAINDTKGAYANKTKPARVTLNNKLNVLLQKLHNCEQELRRVTNEHEGEKRQCARFREQYETMAREHGQEVEASKLLHERVQKQDEEIVQKDARIVDLEAELSAVQRELETALNEVHTIDSERRGLEQALLSEKDSTQLLKEQLEENEVRRVLCVGQVQELTSKLEEKTRIVNELLTYSDAVSAMNASLQRARGAN